MSYYSEHKQHGVLRSMAEREWEWYKLFGNDSPLFPMHEVLKIQTERYGINHKRYFNIIWGYIEELWLEDVMREHGVI